MKGFILEANLEGHGWESRLFTIFLIVTWELRSPQKRGVNRKRVGSFGSYSAWEGANDLPRGKKGLPRRPGLGGNYTD